MARLTERLVDDMKAEIEQLGLKGRTPPARLWKPVFIFTLGLTGNVTAAYG